MSNILCMAVSKIKPSGKLEYNKQLGAENTYKVYQAMSEIVIHSAETFIQEDFEYVKGQCDFCGVISVYKFAGKRCLESCEACGDWFTNIKRVADFND